MGRPLYEKLGRRTASLFYFLCHAFNIRNQGQRRLLIPMFIGTPCTVDFLMQIKRKLRTFFIRYFINITCMFYIEKAFFITRTLMYRFQYIFFYSLYTYFFLFFHLLADLNGRVQMSNQ